VSATCTVTLAATTTASGVTDAVFNDPSTVALLIHDVANYIQMQAFPVLSSGTVTTNINNNAYTITYTVADN
jgi:hypothetical protein